MLQRTQAEIELEVYLLTDNFHSLRICYEAVSGAKLSMTLPSCESYHNRNQIARQYMPACTQGINVMCIISFNSLGQRPAPWEGTHIWNSKMVKNLWLRRIQALMGKCCKIDISSIKLPLSLHRLLLALIRDVFLYNK